VLHQIGAGTLGPVYRGHDTQRERLVAVKLFKLDLPPERVHQLVAGLERIVEANLAHPAIATPVAAGLTGDSAYLACDYISADSLDLAVREFGAWPPADALQVGARLASALDHAVAAGLTHGCLHPRDVLMSARVTRLTGVGVGQLLAEIGIAPPVRRPYSAPERLGGSAWDRRADIFSLAALVHELLWGRRISATGAKAVEGMTALAGGDLDALKRVFKRALAEDPMERHPTAKIFVDALKRALPDVAAEALALNLAADSMPPPAARNLRLAMPDRPAKDDVEPMLPLEPPRFAEVESVPDLPMTAAGPSIIESTPDPIDPIDIKPETDAARDAIDRFALSWLAREADAPKVEPPFELPTFFEADRSAPPADISFEPIVISDREVIPDPEIIPERVATPGSAAVPEAVAASEAARALEVVPAPEVESAQKAESAPEVMPAPEPAPTPEPPAPAPSRRMSRTGPRSKSTNTLIGDSQHEPTPLSAFVAENPPAAKSEIPVREPTTPRPGDAVETAPPPTVPDELTMLDRSRSAVWPLVLALAVGVALGFAGGYAVGVRSQPATVAATDASAAPAAPLREFTEAAVPAAPKPAAAPDPAETTSKPEIVSRPVEPPPENVTREPVTRAPEPAAVRPPNPPAGTRRTDAAPAASRTPAASPAPATWAGGRVNIRSTPPGATVSVDDRAVGRTPTAVRDLQEGPHRIRITRDGYAVHDRRIVITRERPVQLINAALERQSPPAGRGAPLAARSPAPPVPAAAAGTGMLTVESRPAGARVLLDGKVIGTTPLTTQSVPAGVHAIRLELDGYRIWAGAVRVAANEQARVRASLER
jgi:serine/threonine protein kinase